MLLKHRRYLPEVVKPADTASNLGYRRLIVIREDTEINHPVGNDPQMSIKWDCWLATFSRMGDDPFQWLVHMSRREVASRPGRLPAGY
jgi:hypothetical protein